MIARAKNPTVCWTSCRYRFRWADGAAGVVDVAKTQFKRERRQAIDLQGQTSIRASGRRGYPSLKCDDISEIRRSSSLPCRRSGYDRAVLHGVSGQPPHRTEDSIMYQVGHTRVFFTRCDQHQPGPYAKEEVGLNQLAFGVRTLEELQTIQERLGRAGISNSGIKKDRYRQKEFIWLDDPDKMRIEFYLRPA